MKNLYRYTREYLHGLGYYDEDIVWVGSRDGTFAITWDDFRSIANVDYEDRYEDKDPQIVTDLVIILSDGSWIQRYYYRDYGEDWEHLRLPKRDIDPKVFTKVKAEQHAPFLGDVNNDTAKI